MNHQKSSKIIKNHQKSSKIIKNHHQKLIKSHLYINLYNLPKTPIEHPWGLDIEHRLQELGPANMSGTNQALHWASLNNRWFVEELASNVVYHG